MDERRRADRARHHVLHEPEHAHALERRGHHHPGKAGARLADLERLHRLAGAERHVLGELVETGRPARCRGVAAELRAKGRIGEQPLDDAGRRVGIGGGHRQPSDGRIRAPPRRRASSGGPTTSRTGTRSAAHSVASTTHTTDSGAWRAMIGSNRSEKTAAIPAAANDHPSPATA